MSCRHGLKSVCKRMAPRGESIEEEEEWAKKGPLSYLQIYKEGKDNLSPRYRSSNECQKKNHKKNHKRQGQENQTRSRDCHCKQVFFMDEACEQALRLVRNESVQPLATAALLEFREWKLDHRKPRTAAERTN